MQSLPKYGDIGLPTVEVGKLVVEILKKHEIPVKWDGTENERIRIGEKR